jgi:hypothetical protein
VPFKNASRRKAYGKAWRKLNKSKQKQYNKKWKESLKIWYSNYKSAAKCAVCDEGRGVALEAHHVNKKDKSFSLFEGVKRGMSIRRLEAEAAKCIFLCASCHRIFHHNAFTPGEQQKFDLRIKKFEEENGTHDFGQPVVEKKKKKKKNSTATLK